MANAELPDKLSDLIEFAIEAGKALDRNVYVAKWERWHGPGYSRDGRCGVCLAGAVMADRLGGSPEREIDPVDFVDCEGSVASKLYALDYARRGRLFDAADILMGGGGDSMAGRYQRENAFTSEQLAVFRRYEARPPRHGGFVDWAGFDRFCDEAQVMAIDLRLVGL